LHVTAQVPVAVTHAATPSMAGGGHVLHATPPSPHSAVVSAATHPSALQHPSGQDAAPHATQVPSEQTLPVPHGFPWLTAFPATQSGPDEQDIVPLRHVLPVGVHSAFGVQETQLPAPSQTPLGTVAVSQALPAAAFVVWSVHVGTPAVHAVTLPR
jgi:hypothetical protein